MNNVALSPPTDCSLCPRLLVLRQECQKQFPDWHNAPVPSFGSLQSQFAIIGLAPGKKGANRTGRPFTGDFAGFLLYETLLKFGFAKGQFLATADDGLELMNLRIMNAVKCLPPNNKPNPDEIKNCAVFLTNELQQMPHLKIILALGHIAHETVLNHFNCKKSSFKFGHGAKHILPNGMILINSYHCSRYNTQTNRLTTQQFHDVFQVIVNNL